ncbi:hypothetical protein LB506_007304 [Fusarium annulatum]|nr:hypothetical protein LB506_007304 [Fusarium annulatum]
MNNMILELSVVYVYKGSPTLQLNPSCSPILSSTPSYLYTNTSTTQLLTTFNMRFSIAAASTALLALAEARITGIKVPKEIAVGEPFEAIIVRENYIQSVFDSSIVFGYAPESQYPGTIGQVADSFALGKAQSNKVEPLKKKLTIPEGATKGKGLVTAALLSIYGASGSPTISEYNVTVTFGDKTSKEYASSS